MMVRGQRGNGIGATVLFGHAILASDVKTADGGVTSVALYEGHVMKDYRANLKNLLVDSATADLRTGGRWGRTWVPYQGGDQT